MKIKKLYKGRPAITGQLSIFAILIFQTLFILFAMSLNIALVTHDKINLQNSVDIAAYYGATKQAEMLNAIAHINYQIRQSWKLLVWRYRVLGSMYITRSPKPQYMRRDIPDDTEWIPPVIDGMQPGPYFFCVGHNRWGVFNTSHTPGNKAADEICRDMDFHISSLRTPDMPNMPINFGGLSDAIKGARQATKDANLYVHNLCNTYGVTSWYLGFFSFLAFLRDQTDRKIMIYHLAQKLAEGKSLDGDIKEGVKKTFENNLSYINKKALTANSLTHKTNFTPNQEPTWLKDDNQFVTAPPQNLNTVTGYYAAFTGNDGATLGQCTKELKLINEAVHSISPEIQNLVNWFNSRTNPWPGCHNTINCAPSAGLYKDPALDKMIYYAVKAELKYNNQIFLPFNNEITLKAQAFAKPFGGRIGPPKDADILLPTQETCGRFTGTRAFKWDKACGPNYSRFPGDLLGLRSHLVHHHWSMALNNTATRAKSIWNYVKPNNGGKRDPLAIHDDNSGGAVLSTKILARAWEQAAIAPDIFDITYFTILPYYQFSYFPKIKKLLDTGPAQQHIRGDLGTYYDGSFKGDSILAQFGDFQSGSTLENSSAWGRLHSGNSNFIYVNSYPTVIKPFYKVPLDLLLTGWNPPRQKYQGNDYEYPPNPPTANTGPTFGYCKKWVHNFGLMDNPTKIAQYMNDPKNKGMIANGCIYGGRTGYSVKLVDRKKRRIPKPPGSGWK